MGFDNKTIYIGKTDNRIKIYNKKIESNLDIKGELTRIEISKKSLTIMKLREYAFIILIMFFQICT